MKRLLFYLLPLALLSCKYISTRPTYEVCAANYGEISTIKIYDTVKVISHGAKIDTIIALQRLDTIVLSKDRLRVQVVRLRDSILIEGECKSDTIYHVRTNTITKTEFIKPKKPWYEFPWYVWLVIALFIVLLITLRK